MMQAIQLEACKQCAWHDFSGSINGLRAAWLNLKKKS
jgi:hypothetical protein